LLTPCGDGFAKSVGGCRTLRLIRPIICPMLGCDMEIVQPNWAYMDSPSSARN
jgi:hypothetical protein